MTEQEALYRGILADPDDDAPRLVYADWLDENGEAERAEFVRLHSQLARMREWEPGHTAKRLRAERLLHERHRQWSDGVAPLLAEGAYSRRGGPYRLFERGFLGRAPMTDDGFIDRAGELFGLAPVRELWIDTRTRDLASLLTAPRVRDLRGLLFCCSGPDRITHLGGFTVARSETLAGLTRLGFVMQNLGVEGIRAVMTSRHLRGLRALGIEHERLGNQLHALMPSFRLPELRELRLEHCGLTVYDMAALANSPTVADLERLDLAHNREAGDTGLATLARSPNVANLRSLDLTGCDPSEAALAALAGSRHLAGLRKLRLSSSAFTLEAATAFVRGLKWDALGWLTLSGCPEEAAIALANTPAASELVVLDLPGSNFTDAGLTQLARCRHLGKVERLAISGRFCGDAVAQLLASGAMPNLVSLAVQPGYNEVGVFGVALAREPASAGLRELDLGYGSLSNASAAALIESPHLDALERIRLSPYQLSEESKSGLRERFGSAYR